MSAKCDGEVRLRREFFTPSAEGEARLLLLIDTFTTKTRSLEGRTKLAKLDFFLRYPAYLSRALEVRSSEAQMEVEPDEERNIENRMVRYRFGPWDPSYYGMLGRLIGKGLIRPVPVAQGIGFRSTDSGSALVKNLKQVEEWRKVAHRATLLKRHLNLSGTGLKNFVYEYFPEVTQATWGEKL